MPIIIHALEVDLAISAAPARDENGPSRDHIGRLIDRWRKFLAETAPLFREEQELRGQKAAAHAGQRDRLRVCLDQLAEQLESDCDAGVLRGLMNAIRHEGEELQGLLAEGADSGVFAYLGFHFQKDGELGGAAQGFVEAFTQAKKTVDEWREEFTEYTQRIERLAPDTAFTFLNYADFLRSADRVLERTRRGLVRAISGGHDKLFQAYLGEEPRAASTEIRKHTERLQRTLRDLTTKKDAAFQTIDKMRGKYTLALRNIGDEYSRATQKMWVFDPTNDASLGQRNDLESARRQVRETLAKKLGKVGRPLFEPGALHKLASARRLRAMIGSLMPVSRLRSHGDAIPEWEGLERAGKARIAQIPSAIEQVDHAMKALKEKGDLLWGEYGRHSYEFRKLAQDNRGAPSFENYKKKVIEPAKRAFDAAINDVKDLEKLIDGVPDNRGVRALTPVSQQLVEQCDAIGARCDEAHRALVSGKQNLFPTISKVLEQRSMAGSELDKKLDAFKKELDGLKVGVEAAREAAAESEDDEPPAKDQKKRLRKALDLLDKQLESAVESQREAAQRAFAGIVDPKLQQWTSEQLNHGMAREAEQTKERVLKAIDEQLRKFKENSEGLLQYLLHMAKHEKVSETSNGMRGQVVMAWLQASAEMTKAEPDVKVVHGLSDQLRKLHRAATAELSQLDKYIANLRAEVSEDGDGPKGAGSDFLSFVLPKYEKTRKELSLEISALRKLSLEFVGKFAGLKGLAEKAENQSQQLVQEIADGITGKGGGVRGGPSASGKYKEHGEKASAVSSQKAEVDASRKHGLSGVLAKERDIKTGLGVGKAATKPLAVDHAADASDATALVGSGASLLFSARKLQSTVSDVRSNLIDKGLSAINLGVGIGRLVEMFTGTKYMGYLTFKGAFSSDFSQGGLGFGTLDESLDGMGFGVNIISPVATVVGSMKTYRHGTSAEAGAKAVTGFGKLAVMTGAKTGIAMGAKALALGSAASGGLALIPSLALFAADKYFNLSGKATQYVQGLMQGTRNVQKFANSLDKYNEIYDEYSSRIEPRVSAILNRPELKAQMQVADGIGKGTKLINKLERNQVQLLMQASEVEDRFTLAWREIEEKTRKDKRIGDNYDLKAAMYFDMAMKFMGFKLKREAVRQNAMVFEPLIRDYSDPQNQQLRKLGERYTALLHLEQLGADASDEDKARMSQEKEFLQLRYDSAILSKALDENWRGQALGGALGVSKTKVRSIAKKLSVKQSDFIGISLVNGLEDEELKKHGLSDRDIELLRKNPRSWREFEPALRKLLASREPELRRNGLDPDLIDLLKQDSDNWTKHLPDYAMTLEVKTMRGFDHKPINDVLAQAKEACKKLDDTPPAPPVWKGETEKAISAVQADNQKLLAARNDLIHLWKKRFAKKVRDYYLQAGILDMLQQLGAEAAITSDDSGKYPLLRSSLLGLFGMYQKMMAERDPQLPNMTAQEEQQAIEKLYKDNAYELRKMDEGSYFAAFTGKVTFNDLRDAYRAEGFLPDGDPEGLSEELDRFYGLVKSFSILWGGVLGDYINTEKLRKKFDEFTNLVYPISSDLALKYAKEREKPIDLLGAAKPGGDRFILKDRGAIGAFEDLDNVASGASEQVMAGNTFMVVRPSGEEWPKGYKLILASKIPGTTNPDEVVERYVKEEEIEDCHISASFFTKALDEMFLRHEEEREGLDKNTYALLMRQGMLTDKRGLNMASNLGTTGGIFHVLEVTASSCEMKLIRPGLYYEWKTKKLGGRGLKKDYEKVDLEIPDEDLEEKTITLEKAQAGHKRYLVALETEPTRWRMRDRWLVRALDPETVRDMGGMDGWVSTKDVKKVSITKPFEEEETKRYNEYLDKIYADNDTLPKSASTVVQAAPEEAEKDVIEEAAKKRGGFQLDILTKAMLEQMLGKRLGDAEIFVGQEAGRMADSIYAEAFAFGGKVFFASGRFNALSPEGLGLLAHELTHVAQHERGEFATRSEASLEAEAHAVQHVVERRAAPAPAPAPSAPPPMTFARERPAAESVQAPSRKATDTPKTPKFNVSNRCAPRDALDEVMQRYNVRRSVQRQDMIDFLSDQVLELMGDDIEIETERREAMSGTPFTHNS